MTFWKKSSNNGSYQLHMTANGVLIRQAMRVNEIPEKVFRAEVCVIGNALSFLVLDERGHPVSKLINFSSHEEAQACLDDIIGLLYARKTKAEFFRAPMQAASGDTTVAVGEPNKPKRTWGRVLAFVTVFAVGFWLAGGSEEGDSLSGAAQLSDSAANYEISQDMPQSLGGTETDPLASRLIDDEPYVFKPNVQAPEIQMPELNCE